MRLALASVLILSLLALSPSPAAMAQTGRLAFVNSDASLVVGGRHVRLYGIYVPFDQRTCDTRIRPTRCASRAALALDFKIQAFVHCRFLGRNADRSHAAFCSIACRAARRPCGEDLGGWLISQGWAVAAPGAPFDYVVRERIARERGRGVWGLQADSVTFR